MADLASLYETGQGGPPDIAKAFELYRRAATAGDRTSMTKLGNFYESGNGVRQDYTEAIRWYKQSAERGDEAAMRQLGKLYEEGEAFEGALRKPAAGTTEPPGSGPTFQMYLRGVRARQERSCYGAGGGDSNPAAPRGVSRRRKMTETAVRPN
jgi:TPR repeat protein